MSNEISELVVEMNAARRERDESAVFEWKHNALRHSYISYRLAAIQDRAKVALEAGNSPQMIFQHYRELVRRMRRSGLPSRRRVSKPRSH